MLTRRAFHQRLLMLAAASALPRPALATPTALPDTLLNRLTFGATPELRAELAALGPAAWLDAQLAMPATHPDLDARLNAARLRITYEAGQENREDGTPMQWNATDELRPLSLLNADPATLVHLLDFSIGMDYSERERPAHEVIAASLIRAVHAPAQLREVMTQFWHDHFNVNALKFEGTAVFFPSYDAMLRDHALGNFRQMLGAVARAPAMLYYLNNEDSRASPANENFARELLELHTLGAIHYVNDTAPNWHDVPGAADGLATGYIDQDVFEVARAFTGWTVGDGRYITDGLDAPKTGQFFYAENWHDPYQKRILAVEFPPNRAPMADGDQVLDILSTHPGTARFVCTKLIRRLLTDTPDPAMVDRIAATFLATSAAPDQIAQVIRAIVNELAFAQTPPQKLRRPFEFMAALFRATGAAVHAPEKAFDYHLASAGWHQHSYGPPTGHPDVMARWTSASSLNRSVDTALMAHDDWFGCTNTALGTLMPPGAQSYNTLTAFWRDRMFGSANSDPLPDLIQIYDISNLDEPFPLSDEDRQGFAISAVALYALTPQFMLR
ncbi:MAG: DUF1800 domain-containing protein [Paracoccaceae bacterium]